MRKLLMSKQTHANTINAKQSPILHYTIKHGNLKSVKLLLQSGANLHATDKSNLNKILMSHSTPASKAFANLGNTSLANSRDLDKTFKEQVCRPEQKVVENKLHKIVKEKTNIFFLKLIELSLTDEETQSKIDERYLRLGTYVPNEVRAKKGLPGIKKGDEQIEMSPQVKAEQAAQAAQSRARDQQRTANATDSRGEGRNDKGNGRTEGTA